jgi:hypothetical protein
LVFITEVESVYSAVRTESLYKQTRFVFKGLNSAWIWCHLLLPVFDSTILTVMRTDAIRNINAVLRVNPFAVFVTYQVRIPARNNNIPTAYFSYCINCTKRNPGMISKESMKNLFTHSVKSHDSVVPRPTLRNLSRWQSRWIKETYKGGHAFRRCPWTLYILSKSPRLQLPNESTWHHVNYYLMPRQK